MTTRAILTATDLHQSAVLYDQLRAAVDEHRPDVVALVGDFLDDSDDRRLPLSKADCARRLAALPCGEIVFVRGNHEGSGWQPFAAAWRETGRPLRALHAEAFVSGPLVIVGFPCVLGEAFHFLNGREPAIGESTRWLRQIVRAQGPAARFLWLMHEPPQGTRLAKPNGVLAGNAAWTAAIERYSPQLVVFGHDHATPLRRSRWRETLCGATCVNLGQQLAGPLRYSVIKAAFPQAVPSLPRQLSVTAHPQRESVELIRSQ